MIRLLIGSGKTNKAPLCGKEAVKTQRHGRQETLNCSIHGTLATAVLNTF